MSLIPSNDPDIALAQEWLGELEAWLTVHGTKGFDPFDIKAHPRIRALQAKPFLRKTSTVLCDAFPRASRRWLGVAPTENPKTHALLAIGRLRIHQFTGDTVSLEAALAHLQWLREHAWTGSSGLCWGYPFWVYGAGVDIPTRSPIAVVSAIAGEAFLLAHYITGAPEHLEGAQSIARHFMEDLPRLGETDRSFCFAYGLADHRAVHNANLLVAQHLLEVAVATDDEAMARVALRAVQFTLDAQRADGAFAYGAMLPGARHERALMDLVDHHHTGFVLRSLAAVNVHAQNVVIKDALKRGYAFYKTLLDANGLPHGEHSLYPVDIHACAEAILCHATLEKDFMGARQQSVLALRWAWAYMRDPKDGAPYYRKYEGFTSKMAYPRWGVAWIYRALAEYLWRFDSGR
jgi:hypothetical protein